MPSPDPISEPKAYQDHLLSLLGADDPAEVQAATVDTLPALVKEAAERFATKPEPREWSVLECIGHLADAEIVYSGRYRWILSHDEPPLIGYDQDRWVDTLHADDRNADELIEVFTVLRRANLALWRATGDAGKARVGMHSERGPESFDLSFRLIAGHDRFHLKQARETLEAVSR
ncbi:MAG: DinB family protein [Actinomycetota bacterium]